MWVRLPPGMPLPGTYGPGKNGAVLVI
jgi:hypothetical protein